MALVIRSQYDVKSVKNLGWLTRHAGEVRHITVQPVSASRDSGAVLTAYLAPAPALTPRYEEVFASAVVLDRWLARSRSLKGVPVARLAPVQP